MKIFGINFGRKGHVDGDIDTILSRLQAAYETVSGIHVTAETCMQAPTVQAIVQAVTRRIASLPVGVLQKSVRNGRTYKEPLPGHGVSQLLATPNNYQTNVNFWMDSVSWLMRYGRFACYKARGRSGPVRRLMPMHPASMNISQDKDTMDLTFKYTSEGGKYTEYTMDEVLFVRGPARDGATGDSPVHDVREAIALEIAAERFGSAFFGNGAMPMLIFKFIQGVKGFKTDEDKKEFIRDFQDQYSDRRRFRAMALPVGMEVGSPINVENDKAQFIDTRKYQRTVIAGAWGVPPHLVGDLERATFNNVEQQGIDFIVSVVLPYVRIIEAAMERDLLTPQERAEGICIRFNLEGALRGDFKSRQEGLKIQRECGIISANEWREHENMNPISDEDGGETYWRPSNFTTADAPIEPAKPPAKPAPAKVKQEKTYAPNSLEDYYEWRRTNIVPIMVRHALER